MSGLQQIGNGGFAAQNADAARRVRPHFLAAAAAHQAPSAAMTSGRTSTYGSITWSLVSVNLPLMPRAHALQRRAEAGLHVARQIEIDQAVGRADLHFGIVVPSRQNQRVEAALACQLGELFDHLDADVGRIGV